MYRSLTRGFTVVAVVAVFAGLQSIASADDLVPPPWRGTGLYTIQAWEFHDPGEIAPDDDEVATNNPNGTPLGGGDGEGGWTSNFDNTGLDGYVGGNTNFLDFQIPNYIDFEPIKLIRVQINGIWEPSVPPFVSGIGAIDNEVGDDVAVGPDGSEETFPGFHRWEDWHIIPNPDIEFISIALPTGAFVNQVVIETTSFPEPASAGLLAVGGMAMLARRRS